MMNNASAMTSEFGSWLQQLGNLPESYLLALLSVLACVGIGLYRYQIKHRNALEQQRRQKKEVADLRTLIQSQSSAMLILSERILALEDYLELVGSRQQRLEQDKQLRQHSYQEAIQIADSGANVEELMERFGISASEADLISLLYGKAS